MKKYICSAVQCSSVQCSAVQCSAEKYREVQSSAVQCSAEPCSAIKWSAVQCSAVHRRFQQLSTCKLLRFLHTFSHLTVIFYIESLLSVITVDSPHTSKSSLCHNCGQPTHIKFHIYVLIKRILVSLFVRSVCVTGL